MNRPKYVMNRPCPPEGGEEEGKEAIKSFPYISNKIQ